ncbi:hypothetical protein FUAX_06290 [Fulvitalea axinellae]|uniref:DUF1456 family protein n=1 Tax=Fulvitalea axinellae TaxID=1182444 RepID=A0AAU9CS71_9BACT|nr:hypothetical protein FUAX_06290 [Fulvitalea axinellae]
MTNNDILRRLRYTFNYNDAKMVELFGMGGLTVTKEQIQDWLIKEDEPGHVVLVDKELATFLNGFITEKRGKKDGPMPRPEDRLNNNIILRKLRIALNLKDDGMLAVFKLADMRVGKHELSAFFRKPSQQQYRVCKDQFLRNFLMGLQKKHRKAPKKEG